MEHEPLSKQIKLSEPPPSQAAMDLINKAKQKIAGGSDGSPTSVEQLIEWNALDVVSIHIVFCESDLVESKRCFKPKLAHQIFGQKEKMFGYLFPKINIYFMANSARCFVNFTHKGICHRQADTVNAKIIDNLISWLPEDYFTDENRFIQAIGNEDHKKMFGNEIMQFELYNFKEHSTRKFIIRDCSIEEPGFTEFHARFQCMIVWYIDAASQLDLEDPNWMFIYVYEEIRLPHKKQVGYYPVGYSAVYKFFHYPDKIRARISQCFVLPCCQRMGIGFKLLAATYKAIASLPNAVDITVEDPCPAFQRLRDTVDSTLLRQLECFRYPLIKNGFTKRMFDDANRMYKINKRQCRRIYHILRMGHILLNDNKEENQSLLKDIHCFLGIPEEVATAKIASENDTSNKVNQNLEKVNIPSALERYVNEIRPIAWRMSKLLKEDNL